MNNDWETTSRLAEAYCPLDGRKAPLGSLLGYQQVSRQASSESFFFMELK